MKTLTFLVICISAIGIDLKNNPPVERCFNDEYFMITPSFAKEQKLNSVEILWNAFNDYTETELKGLLEYII